MANNSFPWKNPEHKKRRTALIKKGKNRIPAIKILLGFIILSVVGLGIYTIAAFASTPSWDPSLLSAQKQSSIVYDKDGAPIAQLHASENRLIANYEDIPKLVRDTVVSVEDKRFYDHHGADPIRIIKAAFNDLKAGKVVEGGSTITIQLAKDAFIEDPTSKSLKRKIQELFLALQIERNYTKDEILTFYLNRIFFGESSFGVRTAGKTYFGKELKDLNPAEVALLAGLPQAPSGYDPYIHPDAAKKRRTIVLGIMKENNLITAEEYDKYKDEPFTFVEKVQANQAKVNLSDGLNLDKQHPYFVDKVIAELQDVYNIPAEQIYNGGLQIYTTVDSKIQTAAEAAFAKSENFPNSIDNTPVQGAMTVLDTKTGAIVAMMGGREYSPMGLNRAWQSRRQPGSTAKPLVVYSPALEKGGYYPGTVFDDMPVTFGTGSAAWSPVDYDTQSTGWKGLITMREAVRNSVNVYAVRLFNALGIDYCWQFAKNNLEIPLEEKDKVLSLSLGTFQISTLEMASAYGTFANSGIKTEPFSVLKVVGPDQKVLVETNPSQKRVMKETTAYIMNDLLRSVVTSGTGTRAAIGNWYICGKTGTTSLDPNLYGYKTGNPDAWFAGYSPKYVGVVWMGYDSDPDKKHYLRQVYGGNYPAKIWNQVMTVAHAGLPVQSSIPIPQGITRVSFDTKSGLLPSSLTPSQFISSEICATDSVPSTVSNVWEEVLVDPNNPNQLAREGSLNAVTRICLNLPNRSKKVTWPSDELPYKMPAAITANTPAGNVSVENPPAEAGNPPAGDPGLPQLTIGYPKVDRKVTKVQIPLLSSFDSNDYSVIIYIKKPGTSYLDTSVPEDGNTKALLYYLYPSGSNAVPGTYTFWVSLTEKSSGKVGPPSNAVSFEIVD